MPALQPFACWICRLLRDNPCLCGPCREHSDSLGTRRVCSTCCNHGEACRRCGRCSKDGGGPRLCICNGPNFYYREDFDRCGDCLIVLGPARPRCTCCVFTPFCRECCLRGQWAQNGHDCCFGPPDIRRTVRADGRRGQAGRVARRRNAVAEDDEDAELVRQVAQARIPYFWFPHQGKCAEADANTAEAILVRKEHPGGMVDPRGFAYNPSRRFAAVEIEVAGYTDAAKLNNVVDLWRCGVAHDGSIVEREGDDFTLNPFEIQTAPACGDALHLQLSELTEALKLGKAKVNLSCGLHVHVDCRDIGYHEIQKLVRIYAKIEEALYASVHPSRYNCDYTGHCGKKYMDTVVSGIKPETKVLKKAFITTLYGENALRTKWDEPQDRPAHEPEPPAPARNVGRFIAEFQPGARPVARPLDRPAFYQERRGAHGPGAGQADRVNNPRYKSLNLHSFFQRGTIESRLHHGSLLFDEIFGWARVNIDLIDVANSKSDAFIRKACEGITAREKADVENFLTKRCGAHNTLLMRKDCHFDEVWDGLVVLQRAFSPKTFEYVADRIAYFADSNNKTTLPTTIHQKKENAKEG